MLQANIHHDLTQYKAKAVMGLSYRSVLWLAAAAAGGVGMGLYCAFVLGLDTDDMLFLGLVIAGAAPGALMVFAKPDGMSLEKWLPLWVRHRLTNRRVLYCTNRRDAAQERADRAAHEAKHQARLRTVNGRERALHSDQQCGVAPMDDALDTL